MKQPPTARDLDQSIVHEGDSTVYNLQHAAAHVGEALRHAQAQRGRLGKQSKYRPHIRALGRGMTR